MVAGEVQALLVGLAQRLPADGIVPRRLLAIGLIALMYGGLSLARAVKGTDLSDEVLRACRALGAAAARGGKGERS
jgi:TetR/AcrR family transcriptional repressor of nem operon